MFKKLKQKIEEGGDGGIEKVSFSQRRFPGSAVRTLSQSGEEETRQVEEQPAAAVEEEESRDEGQGVVLNDSGGPLITGVGVSQVDLPNHLASKSGTSYETILEARVKELEQKCASLSDVLSRERSSHSEDLASLTGRLERSDGEMTNLRIEVVELQLEKSNLQQQRDNEAREMQEKVEAIQQEKEALEKEILNLKEEVDKNEKAELEASDRYSELEKKTQHLQSRLDAYSTSDESQVIQRLQTEVADLEKSIQMRNLEIQVLERRVAVQARERGDDTDIALEREQKLEEACHDLTEQLNEVKSTNKELMSELTKERENGGRKERELTDLQSKLHHQMKTQQRLMEELDQLRSNHARHMQDVEELVLEKDHRITELLQSLKHLRGDPGIRGEMETRPPGLARRTASIGVQTLSPWLQQLGEELVSYESGGAAVLPLSSDITTNEEGQGDGNEDYITMKSLGPEEEMEVMRQQQLRMEEQITEKNKIIRVQQQKIVDMRKELQKSVSFPDLSSVASKSKLEHSPSPPPDVAMTTEINFQYLKHVVIRFMCSRDEEALKLIRAVSTLLHFSPQEEKHVKDFLYYKLSWFGRMPAPLYQPLVKTHRT